MRQDVKVAEVTRIPFTMTLKGHSAVSVAVRDVPTGIATLNIYARVRGIRARVATGAITVATKSGNLSARGWGVDEWEVELTSPSGPALGFTTMSAVSYGKEP